PCPAATDACSSAAWPTAPAVGMSNDSFAATATFAKLCYEAALVLLNSNRHETPRTPSEIWTGATCAANASLWNSPRPAPQVPGPITGSGRRTSAPESAGRISKTCSAGLARSPSPTRIGQHGAKALWSFKLARITIAVAALVAVAVAHLKIRSAIAVAALVAVAVAHLKIRSAIAVAALVAVVAALQRTPSMRKLTVAVPLKTALKITRLAVALAVAAAPRKMWTPSAVVAAAATPKRLRPRRNGPVRVPPTLAGRQSP
uniref:Secreted protein n=1 Tax=Macrostomum lignano TaxID=282301 RepID=A0A1I8JND0_9PLAT